MSAPGPRHVWQISVVCRRMGAGWRSPLAREQLANCTEVWDWLVPDKACACAQREASQEQSALGRSE